MLINQSIGIVSYGAYLPAQVILAAEIEKVQGRSGVAVSLGVSQKMVPSIDEDTTTLATTVAVQALERWDGDRQTIHSLFIGSESHPYAVKPTGTMVKEALGLSDQMSLADLQFACKAGTQALQISAAYTAAGMVPAALAIGADTAQSRPGDVLEFTAASGAAAYILGNQNLLAKLLATTSVATDTPDFWRRPGQEYPEHAGRFSGEPAYFAHVTLATQNLLAEVGLTPADIDYCVFHTPNAKFPQAVAQQLGFQPHQLQHNLIVKKIGNTYAAASLLALANVLDTVEAGKKILVTSYGSGAGADSFLFETTPLLVKKRKNWHGFLAEKIAAAQPISYQEYRRCTSQS